MSDPPSPGAKARQGGNKSYSDLVGYTRIWSDGREAVETAGELALWLSTSLKRGVNEMRGQGTCALFLITVFIRFVVVDVSFLALNHFHAQKYEEEGGTSTVLP
jgi:hypothetical protein